MDLRTGKSRDSLFVGLIFMAIALAFGVTASGYQIGSGGQAGPGLFPMALSIALFGLGFVTTIQPARERTEPVAPTPWRGIALITISLGIFGSSSSVLGFVPAVIVCTFLSALSSSRNSIASAALIAFAMAALCFLIFKLGLGLNVPTFGPVFSF